jgi:hypothetical protein
MAFPGDDKLETPKPDVGARVKLTLPPATEDMIIERGWDNIAILDPTGLVSYDAQSSPTWCANCRCKKRWFQHQRLICVCASGIQMVCKKNTGDLYWFELKNALRPVGKGSLILCCTEVLE